MKKFMAIILSLVMTLSLSIVSLAGEEKMTVEEAKDYLLNYNVKRTNEFGKEYTTKYVFDSEDDLQKAALYISNNGLLKFDTELDKAIKEAVANEPKSNIPTTRSTNPSAGYAKVSGNGTHYVSAQAYGLASFDTLGTVEYLVKLGYKVTVSNGNFTNITGISFDIPTISAAGSWGNTRFPSSCSAKNCSVTANYDITKTLEVGVGDFSVIVKSETDNEVFALLTSFK